LDKIEMVSRDELEDRLRLYLEQRLMPDYFLYLGDSGSQSWLALSESEEFPVASRLTGLLRASLPRLIPHLPSRFDMASIGVGSGEKERHLLEHLEPGRVERYYAVDVSSQLVDLALQAAGGTVVEKTGVVAFLENLPHLRTLWRSPVLLCLLGNNVCNYEPDYVFELVHQQLGPKDLFLFDCHLLADEQDNGKPSTRQIQSAYCSEPNARFNTGPLLERGLAPEDCRFCLELVTAPTRFGSICRTSKRIEIVRDSEIRCYGKQVSLRAGDTINMGFTYKYTSTQVREYLSYYGFEERESVLSTDGENLLALVRRQHG
jgi:hypothetical protein